MNKKGIANILIIVIVVLVLIAAGGAGYYFVNKHQNKMACTTEAKICPDGTAVGRTGPNCEFAPCPETKKVIYKSDFDGATLYGTLYKSEDNGQTWKQILQQYKGEIVYAVDPKNPDIIYAGDKGGNMMADDMDIDLVKSTDAGEHWTDILKGIVSQIDKGKVIFGIDSLLIDSTDSNIINVSVRVSGGTANFKSLDGGNTWIKVK